MPKSPKLICEKPNPTEHDAELISAPTHLLESTGYETLKQVQDDIKTLIKI
jgi:hypothetical protein